VKLLRSVFTDMRAADDSLGPLAKLRKATIRFVLSVRPSAINNSAPTDRIFVKFYVQIFSENMSRKFETH